MAYIGTKPTIGNFQICDAISVVNGQAAYTMQVGGVNVSPQSSSHMIVSLNGTIRKPGGANPSFTVSGSTITFASNLVTNDVIDFIQILGDVLDLGVPSDATVTTAKLANSAVDLTSKVTGTLPVANGGTNLTSGFANGITMADQWRLTAGISATNGDITANLERVDTPSTPLIGTGMSESSGIFTFPSAGQYLILVQGLFQFTNVQDNQAHIQTNVSTNSGGAYSQRATCTSGSNSSSNVQYFTNYSQLFLDVTDASTFRVKFSTSSLSGSISGNSDYNETSFTFIRLGDT